MPIYEYRCSDCGHQFEKLILSRNTLIECPGCHGTAVEKQFSAFSFQGEHGGGGSRSMGGGGGGCAPGGCGCAS